MEFHQLFHHDDNDMQRVTISSEHELAAMCNTSEESCSVQGIPISCTGVNAYAATFSFVAPLTLPWSMSESFASLGALGERIASGMTDEWW
jgi:hypothetical protein